MLYVAGARSGSSVAAPLASSVAVPIVVEPFMNTTVPVGTGPVAPATVATRIVCGVLPPLEATASVVDVGIACTTCVNPLDVLPLSLASPLYTAATMWLPTASEELLNVAWPPASSVTGLLAAPSMKNTTLPVGVPPLPVTAAVNVMVDNTVAGEPPEVTATEVVARSTSTGRLLEGLGASLASPLY